MSMRMILGSTARRAAICAALSFLPSLAGCVLPDFTGSHIAIESTTGAKLRAIALLKAHSGHDAATIGALDDLRSRLLAAPPTMEADVTMALDGRSNPGAWGPSAFGVFCFETGMYEPRAREMADLVAARDIGAISLAEFDTLVSALDVQCGRSIVRRSNERETRAELSGLDWASRWMGLVPACEAERAAAGASGHWEVPRADPNDTNGWWRTNWSCPRSFEPRARFDFWICPREWTPTSARTQTP